MTRKRRPAARRADWRRLTESEAKISGLLTWRVGLVGAVVELVFRQVTSIVSQKRYILMSSGAN